MAVLSYMGCKSRFDEEHQMKAQQLALLVTGVLALPINAAEQVNYKTGDGAPVKAVIHQGGEVTSSQGTNTPYSRPVAARHGPTSHHRNVSGNIPLETEKNASRIKAGDPGCAASGDCPAID